MKDNTQSTDELLELIATDIWAFDELAVREYTLAQRAEETELPIGHFDLRDEWMAFNSQLSMTYRQDTFWQVLGAAPIRALIVQDAVGRWLGDNLASQDTQTLESQQVAVNLLTAFARQPLLAETVASLQAKTRQELEGRAEAGGPALRLALYLLEDADLQQSLPPITQLDMSYEANSAIWLRKLAESTLANSLQSLIVTKCDITDETLELAGRLHNLERLGLSGTNISAVAIPLLLNLKKLEALDISGTLVNQTALSHLTKFRELKSLNITGCGFDETAKQSLCSELPHCQLVAD